MDIISIFKTNADKFHQLVEILIKLLGFAASATQVTSSILSDDALQLRQGQEIQAAVSLKMENALNAHMDFTSIKTINANKSLKPVLATILT